MAIASKQDKCPFCREKVMKGAMKCKHCQEMLLPTKPKHAWLKRHDTFKTGFLSGILLELLIVAYIYFY